MQNGELGLRIDSWQVDESLLETKEIQRCEVATCQAGCCADGVWVDMAQAQAIFDHAEMITPFLPPDRRNPERWFAEPHDDDPSFPSGAYIGTTTLPDATHPGGSTCVFLRPEDRYCAIQSACLANGRAAWELKPYYCCMFPLVDEYRDGARILMLDKDNPLFEHGGGCNTLSTAAQPTFQVYAEETVFAMGAEHYRQLCEQLGVAPRL